MTIKSSSVEEDSFLSHRTHRHFSSGQRLAQQTRIDTSRMRTQIVIPKVVSVGRLEPKLVGLLCSFNRSQSFHSSLFSFISSTLVFLRLLFISS